MTYSIMNCEHLNEVVHGVGLLVNPSMANAKKAMVWKLATLKIKYYNKMLVRLSQRILSEISPC
jgi:hypothetical protein